MSEQNKGRKSTLKPSVVAFFVFAILIVGAFLIVGLVKTCSADHEAETELVEQTNQMVE